MTFLKLRKRRVMPLGAALMLVVLLGGPVHAMGDFVTPMPLHVPHIIGAAVGVAPDYEGSNDYNFGALPTLNYQFGNRYIRLLGNYLAGNVLDHDLFEFGPVAFYRFGRDDDIDDDVVRRIHEVDDAIELGIFVGFQFFDRVNPRIRYGAKVEFLHDMSDEHDGFTVQLSARGWYPVSKAIDLGMAIGGTYASDDYMTAYFGVTRADETNSGLPFFDAGSGVKDIYVQPMMQIHLSESWHIGAGVRVKGLLDDASDSPVVDDRGSGTQVVAGVGVAYAW